MSDNINKLFSIQIQIFHTKLSIICLQSSLIFFTEQSFKKFKNLIIIIQSPKYLKKLNHPKILMINGKQKIKQQKQQVPKHTFLISATKQCLQVDKNRINFSKYPIFACSHKFIAINVQLLDFFTEAQRKQFHLLTIKVETNVKQYGDVFTFKIVQGGQQVTQMQIPIKQNQPLPIIIKANMPQLQTSTDIHGNLILQVDNFTPMILPINSRGQVPSIVCLKQMVHEKTGFKIIKIPSKGAMNIPFKNSSNINFFFQIKLLSRDQNNPDSDGVRLRIATNNPNQKIQEQRNKKQNTIIKVDANSTFFIGLSFDLLKKDGSIRIARRLLIMQVQGTKLFFTFPIQLIIYD